MKKLLLGLTLFLLMTTYVSSQSSYPRKIVFDSDTCAALSIDNVKVLNLKLQRKKLVELDNRVLLERNSQLTKTIIDLKAQIHERELLLKKHQIHGGNALELLTNYQKQTHRLRDKIRRRKALNWVLMGAVTVLTAQMVIK